MCDRPKGFSTGRNHPLFHIPTSSYFHRNCNAFAQVSIKLYIQYNYV